MKQFVRPQTAELALFDHAQELDLRRRGHVTDLVEKEGAAVGVLEPSDPVAIRACKGALDVSEQFAFENPLADGRAVERHEALVPARGVVVERLGHEFLARAAFARDQDRRVRRGDLRQGVEDARHGRTVADDPLEPEPFVELLLERDVLADEGLLLGRLLDDRSQLLDVDRLLEIVIRTFAHGGDRGLNVAASGEKDHLDRGIELLDVLENFEAVDVGHDQIRDDDVDPAVIPDHADAFLAAGGDSAVAADSFEGLGRRLGVGLFVVNDQNAQLTSHRFLRWVAAIRCRRPTGPAARYGSWCPFQPC